MASVLAVLVLWMLIPASMQQPQDQRSAPGRSGYRLERLELTGITVFPKEELLGLFSVKPGDPVDMASIKRRLEQLMRTYQESGYIDVQYIPEMRVDEAAKSYSFSFDILQGARYYVGRVNFVGAAASSDKALRAASPAIEEGKIYRPSALDETIAGINKLGLFAKLTRDDCKLERSSDRPGQVDITITLRAKTP